MDQPLLRTIDLTKRYGQVTVLDRASIELRAGEILGLLGANGAGKSTLCKIIAGLIPATAGAMRMLGRSYAPVNKQVAERSGVAIVQQELNLVPTLTVAENLLLTRMPSRAGIIRRKQLRQQARQILDRFALSDVDTDTPVGQLGVGRQQMIEIAATLATECKLLILDEPTAALSIAETEQLFQWLDELRSQGVGLIYISHRLDEIARLTDRIAVLRDGKVVCTRQTADVSIDEMIDQMSGENSHQSHAAEYQSCATNRIALQVQRISSGPVQNVSFTVQQGERFGIAGLVGSGRTELLRAIFGADTAASGHVRLGDDPNPRRYHTPYQAVADGIAMVTEDRKQNGLLLTESIRVNATLSSMYQSFSSAGVIRGRLERQQTETLCRSLETRCTGIEQTVETLSGGNQQKVAITKWLLRDAQVFLFDEPTRGIDVAARRRIYRLLNSLAEQGKGIIIVSSDLDELLENCDRIAVMSAGRLIDTFDRANWSEEKIMQAAFAGHRDRQPTIDN